MNNNNPSHFDLQAAAKQLMLEDGFHPDFPPEVQQQLMQIKAQPPKSAAADVCDLRNLLWSSIDNDTSRDLDQIEYAERLPDGTTRVMVGIADVDAFIPKDSPIDKHAASQTCTVYTGVRNFPMIPEELSNGTTSLLEVDGKLSMVTEFVVNSNGEVTKQQIYPAIVTNKAQLAYNGVGAWLEGRGPAPEKVAASAELQAQLKLQDEVAQCLKSERHSHGALNIETIEVSPVILNTEIVDLKKLEKNRATELIEDFMIAANGVVARTLEQAGISSIRRVVKTPRRWDRIVALAAEHGGKLPAEPDSKALNDFLQIRREQDPDHFADVSLTVIKLMGSGEYVLERPGEPSPGHFGLAVQDYTHSTAPNRRFADVVTQRLIKSVVHHQKSPYADGELGAIATNCTEMEDAARKVERGMSKRIAAVTMSRRLGQIFDGIVTGAGPKGTFVRVLDPHVEGMLMHGQGVDVGDRLRVKLVNADPQRGFIDFVRV
ncbi:MAG TPA: RNB domain-containing ribonuclease [Candidatus Angelobacter sp.]|jgi:exoribonuclease-2